MARIPNFADVGFNDPRAVGGTPQFPATSAVADAEEKFGAGLQRAGTAAATIGADMEEKRQKLNAANSSLGLFNELVPLHTAMQIETDPEKLGEIKTQMSGLLEKYAKGIDDPATKASWLATHGNAVIHAVTDIDKRYAELDRGRVGAGLHETMDTTARTAAATGDPAAIDAAANKIRETAKYGEEYGAFKPGAGYSAQRQSLEKMVRGGAEALVNKGQPDAALALLDKYPDAVDAVTGQHLRHTIEAAKIKGLGKSVANEEWGSGSGARSAGGPVERFLNLTEQKESGGKNIEQQVVGPSGGYNPSTGTVTGPSTASGHFQITDTTWQKFAPQAGVDLSAYPRAISAPYDVQRQVARTIATTSGVQHWTDYNKDLRTAAANEGLPTSGPIQGGAAAPSIGAISSNDNNIVAFGDSITAHLIRKAGAGGQESGKVGVYNSGDTAVSGYDPSQVLQVISKTPDNAVRGKNVVLSTGTSNDPDNQFAGSIPAQIAMLRDKGAASVTVMGVGTKYADRNAQLERIAKDNGAAFSGPLRKVAGDGIHSSDPKAEFAAARSAMAPPGMQSASIGTPAGGQDYNSGTAPLPDIETKLQRIQDRVDRGEIPQESANIAMADVRGRYNRVQSMQANERALLLNQLNNGVSALEDGRDFSYDPAQIRHYFPPEKATEFIQRLDDAKEGGQLVVGMRLASPDQIAQQRAQLAGGLDDPKATNYAKRRRMLDLFDKAETARAKALGSDPAGYVAQINPDVAGKFKAIDPQKPETFADYATAALAEQGRLGVPEETRSVLPIGQAAQLAGRIASIDPAKQNPGEALAATAQSYGAYWPQVFGDLVKAKLPGTYQVLATMDRPEQGVAASDLSRAIGLIAEKGGMSALKKAVPDVTQKAIDKGLDDALADFRESTGNQSGGARLYATVRDAAQALAYYHGFRGKSDSDAVQTAVDGILNAKYDFGRIGGTMVRVPKGTLGVVDRAAETVQNSIKPDDLGPVPGNPNLTPDERKGIWLGAIHNGSWVNNEDDSGVVLQGAFRNGVRSVVRRADGSRIEIKFANAPTLAATEAPALAAPVDPRAGLQ